MKALWLENGELSLKGDLPVLEPGGDELLLDVELAGICGTDLELLEGYADFTGVPGHEFVARVAGGQGEWSGKRVVTDINVSCGKCDRCHKGLAKHCATRTVLGIRQHQGAFAEQVVAPVRNCFEIPASMSLEQAALIEPLAAALEILESVDIGENDRVLLVGAGRLAQLIAQVLANTRAEVQVMIRSESRRTSFELLDIECVTMPAGEYDIVVEASGNPDGFALALDAVRPRGTLVLKSTYAGRLSLDASRIVVDEIRIAGSRCGPTAKAIDWMHRGLIRLDHLNIEHLPLEAFDAGFRGARDPAIYKVLLSPQGDRSSP